MATGIEVEKLSILLIFNFPIVHLHQGIGEKLLSIYKAANLF